MNRRGFLGKVMQSAPVLAATALLGQAAAPVAPAFTRLVGVEGPELADLPHPAVVEYLTGEPVYDAGMVRYVEDGFVVRAIGQLRDDALILKQPYILVKEYWGDILRLGPNYVAETVKEYVP